MISLFLNTSSNYLNIALVKDNIVLEEFYKKLDNDVSKETVFNIKKLFDNNNLKPNDVDEIVCVKGPGSFTGLRVGITISKTYAHFLNKKLYSVSSLYLMATSTKEEIIVPIINARRGYVYAAIYDKNYNEIEKEQYIKLEQLIEKVNKLNKKVIYVSNDEFENVKTIKYKPNINNLYKYMNKKEENSITFIPNYLKKTEAEEKLNEKQ